MKKHALEFRLDPARIAIMGESAGGHLVGLAATDSQPDTVGGDTQNQPLIRLGSADLPLLFGGGAAADIANGDSVPPHLGFNALGPERPPPRAHESNDFAPGGSTLIG